MGGCASKPNDLDTAEKAPAPVEAPAAETPAAIDKAVVVESSSEPAPEAATTEEAEAKEAADPAVQAGEQAKTEAEEQVKETPTEEKREVAETAATA